MMENDVGRMTDDPRVEKVAVTKADRDLYKWLLDATKSQSRRIDEAEDDCDELQYIARHRLQAPLVVRAALKRAIADLRTVGDDYPGSSCHKWCHERADEAALSILDNERIATRSDEQQEMADAHKDCEDFTLPSEQALRRACRLADCQWTAINMMRQNGTIEPGFVRAIYAFARFIDDATPSTIATPSNEALLREALTLAEVVAERMGPDYGDGIWHTCSGCYETCDGYDVGHYPHSTIFNCKLGGGCSECGGIGAIWDTTDYEAMGRELAAEVSGAALNPPGVE